MLERFSPRALAPARRHARTVTPRTERMSEDGVVPKFAGSCWWPLNAQRCRAMAAQGGRMTLATTGKEDPGDRQDLRLVAMCT